MTDEALLRETLKALKQIADPESLEKVSDDGPMFAGLGGFKCGCYFDSGIYEVRCNNHYPVTIASNIIAKLEERLLQD